MATKPTESTSTQSGFQRFMKKSWQVMLAVGAAEAILGIIILLWPGSTLQVVATLFGLYLMLSGISEVIVGISSKLMSQTFRLLNIIAGVLSFILGVLCFRSEFATYQMLGWWVGAGVVMTGLSGLLTFGNLPKAPGRGWALGGSVICLVAGIVAIMFPVSTVQSLVLFGGIALIVFGAIAIVNALQWRESVSELTASD